MARLKRFILPAAVGAALATSLLMGGLVVFFGNPFSSSATSTEVKKETRVETEVETALLPLSIKKIFHRSASVPVPVGTRDSGAVTTLKDDALILRGTHLYHFNTTNEKLRPLNIVLPPNNYVERWRHPKFARLRYEDIKVIKINGQDNLLVSFPFLDKQKLCLSLKVFKTPLPPDIFSAEIGADDWQNIFQTPCWGNSKDFSLLGHDTGGRMALSKKRHRVYLTVGVFNREPKEKPAPFSSVVEINVATGKTIIIARGFRNAQGITLDKQNRLWTVEHGPQGGDEINLIRPGKHYGWPFVSYGTDYGTYTFHEKVKDLGKHKPPYEKPIFAFVPSVGPSNLIAVENFAPEWNGDLLVATLRERALYRVRLDGTRAVYGEKIRMPERKRWRYIYNHPTKPLIILLSNDYQDPMFLIRPGVRPKAAVRPKGPKATEEMRQAWRGCFMCHRGGWAAPPIENIFGRKAGATQWRDYSAAMKNSGIRWNKETLAAFLTNPQAVIKGTTMPPQNLSKEQIDSIVLRLKKLKRPQNSREN